MRLRLLIITLVSLFQSLPYPLQATVLPDGYYPQLTEANTPVLDPLFKAWLAKYVDVRPVLDGSQKEVSEKIAAQASEITRAFLSVRNGESVLASSALIDDIKNGKYTAASSDFAMIPYFLAEVAKRKELKPDMKSLVLDLLRQHGGTSCPRRVLLFDDISNDPLNSTDLKSALNTVGLITTFNSNDFRRRALARYLALLSKDIQGEIAPDLLPLVEPFPALLRENKWLEPEATVKEGQIPTSVRKDPTFLTVEAELRRGRCETAESSFFQIIKTNKPDEFVEVETSALLLETCFRRRGTLPRLNFWKRAEEDLANAYGLSGQELALRRQGIIYWDRNEFVTAKELFTRILKMAQSQNDKKIEARTVYTFGRVYENEGSLAEAVKYYEMYIKNFKKVEYYDEALMALVQLHSVSGQKKKSLKYAEILAMRETLKEIDERSAATLSFALYWAGRLYYELNHFARAEELWRRAAVEYYSTFYGALGHVMLEKLIGKQLDLEPSLARPFAAEDLYVDFIEQEKATIDRVLWLLELGLPKEASCEISQIAAQPGENNKRLTKSLLQFAAGEWLPAIRTYGELPRSFRNTLFRGSERILFPRAYDSLVEKYAAKLNVDPDFVYAVIRQESVFNPKARSTAGARGLMQLMPDTARREARSIKNDYLNRESLRAVLIPGDVEYRQLYDEETNIGLGIHHIDRLMKQYKNPVFVLTSYNASPRATERWMRTIPSADILAFVERIPYKETKDYVKLVMRNYFYYQRWYERPSAEIQILDAMVPEQLRGKPVSLPE